VLDVVSVVISAVALIFSILRTVGNLPCLDVVIFSILRIVGCGAVIFSTVGDVVVCVVRVGITITVTISIGSSIGDVVSVVITPTISAVALVFSILRTVGSLSSLSAVIFNIVGDVVVSVSAVALIFSILRTVGSLPGL